jgi:hypothetical protein
MSVSFCVGCGEKHEDVYWRMTDYEVEEGKIKSGWFCSKFFHPAGKTDKQLLEYFAQPFWKAVGVKPTKEELRYDQKLKAEGKTYLDVKNQRLAKAPKVYDNSRLKEAIYNNKLKSKTPVKYNKVPA